MNVLMICLMTAHLRLPDVSTRMVITTVSANKDIKTMDPAVKVNSIEINMQKDKNITFIFIFCPIHLIVNLKRKFTLKN